MGIEIERKFLVDPSKLPLLDPKRSTQITQGYLLNDPGQRIRLINTAIARLTIKGTGTVSRKEFEYDIPRKDAEELLSMCPNQLSKIRHELTFEGHLWVVDQFEGTLKGLWLAEIELTSEDEQFVIPEWAVKEVSTLPEYSNAQLAAHGLTNANLLPNLSLSVP